MILSGAIRLGDMKTFRTGLVVVSIFATLTAGVRGATFTLYDVVPTSSVTNTDSDTFSVSFGNSFMVSPVSTRDDGRTVYQEVIALTNEVDIFPTTTRTVTSDYPRTFTFTRVDDANGSEQTITAGAPANPAVLAQSCSFQGTTQGVCVLSRVVGPSDHATTAVSTYTGIPTPIFTITQSSGGNHHWSPASAVVGSVICSIVSLVTMGATLAF